MNENAEVNSTEEEKRLVGLTGDSFSLGSGDGKRISPREVTVGLTETLMKIHILKTMGDTKEILCYDPTLGIFINNGEIVIQRAVEIIQPDISSAEVNEVINKIGRRTLTLRDRFDSQIEWLTCKNCVVNLKTLETRLHSPTFMATAQIPCKYEPQSNFSFFFGQIEGASSPINSSLWVRCPKIMKFMHEVMADEDVETVLDFMAYCLWRGLPFHKFLLFVGSGRNGKGVMTEIIRRLLGTRNVAGESLQQILTNRFVTARLYGKLANIDADLSKDILRNTDQINFRIQRITLVLFSQGL